MGGEEEQDWHMNLDSEHFALWVTIRNPITWITWIAFLAHLYLLTHLVLGAPNLTHLASGTCLAMSSRWSWSPRLLLTLTRLTNPTHHHLFTGHHHHNHQHHHQHQHQHQREMPIVNCTGRELTALSPTAAQVVEQPAFEAFKYLWNITQDWPRQLARHSTSPRMVFLTCQSYSRFFFGKLKTDPKFRQLHVNILFKLASKISFSKHHQTYKLISVLTTHTPL